MFRRSSFDSCWGLRFFFCLMACHVDQFTFHNAIGACLGLALLRISLRLTCCKRLWRCIGLFLLEPTTNHKHSNTVFAVPAMLHSSQEYLSSEIDEPSISINQLILIINDQLMKQICVTFYRLSSISHDNQWPTCSWYRLASNFVMFYNRQVFGNRHSIEIVNTLIFCCNNLMIHSKKVLICTVKIHNI